MKNITIAFTPRSLSFIDNFRLLLPGFHSKALKANITFHDSPKVRVSRGELVTNFDYLISSDASDTQTELTQLTTFHDAFPERVISLKRISKAFMQAPLIALAKDKKNAIRHFIPVNNHMSLESGYHKNAPNASFGFGLKIPYVIKPANGARGIGHILINKENINLSELIAKINKGDYDAFLQELEENGVTYHRGHEHDSQEGFNMLRNQPLLAQEVIPDIHEEYRLIAINEGDLVFIQKRERTGEEHFKQATGSLTPSSNYKTLAQHGVPAHLITEIKKAVCNICTRYGPLQSIDLFITKKGKWGFFEYSNQFGIAGPGHELTASILIRMIEHQILKRR